VAPTAARIAPNELVKGGGEDLRVVLAETQRGDALCVSLVKFSQTFARGHVPHLDAGGWTQEVSEGVSKKAFSGQRQNPDVEPVGLPP
jgi:hypothetical protein